MRHTIIRNTHASKLSLVGLDQTATATAGFSVVGEADYDRYPSWRRSLGSFISDNLY